MKKNLNKIVMVMMAGLMAVSLAACGNQSKKSSDSKKESTSKVSKKNKIKHIKKKTNAATVTVKKK